MFLRIDLSYKGQPFHLIELNMPLTRVVVKVLWFELTLDIK
jgi:hypothetical protein